MQPKLFKFAIIKPVLWIVLIQIVLIIVAFKDFRLHPKNIVYCNWGDGLKNLFTLQSYVSDPVDSKGLYHFKAFNYPWGEYVNTADNTPAFSMPLRFINEYLFDVSNFAIPGYNFLIAILYLVSSLLCFGIFKRLFGLHWVSFFAAIILPWTNMQTIRVWRGHFNLSFSFLILICLLLFILWVNAKSKNQRIAFALLSMLNVFFSFLFHGYYIAITGLFSFFLFFIYGLYNFQNAHGKNALLTSVLVPVAALLCGVGFLGFTDDFINLRKPGFGGYDWMESKVRFWSLFTSTEGHTVSFPIVNRIGAKEPENMGYIGHMAAFGLLFIGVALLKNSYRTLFAKIQSQFFRQPIFGAIFFAGLFMLFVSWGDKYFLDNSEQSIMFYNILNPLFWVHHVTDYVEQFRCLGRFTWPLFWTTNIWVIYTLWHMAPKMPRKLAFGITSILVVVCGLELKDYIDMTQKHSGDENFLNATHVNSLVLPKKINWKHYQAAVVLPYFNVGTETEGLVLDDRGDVSDFTYKFYLKTRLPLLNVKLSRTVPEQAQQIFNWFESGTPSNEIKNLLDERPILVVKDKVASSDSSWINSIPASSKDFFNVSQNLLYNADLKFLDSADRYEYYAWNVAQSTNL